MAAAHPFGAFIGYRLKRVGCVHRIKVKYHPSEEWVKMREKIRDADIGRKTQTKAISDFLRRVTTDGKF
jgi:hypothetical protein